MWRAVRTFGQVHLIWELVLYPNLIAARVSKSHALASLRFAALMMGQVKLNRKKLSLAAVKHEQSEF